MVDSSLNDALRVFEATEANIVKLERLLEKIIDAIPLGVAFNNDDQEYENDCRDFYRLLEALPTIDNWKPHIGFLTLNDIAQRRFDAANIGEPDVLIDLERDIHEPSREIQKFRYYYDHKRLELIRNAVIDLTDAIDENLRKLSALLNDDLKPSQSIDSPAFMDLANNVEQIGTLLGSSASYPSRWDYLQRHIHFGMVADLRDIINHDWPAVKKDLLRFFYGANEPIPVNIDELNVLVSKKPSGPVATKLKWDKLNEEDFERLIYNLISTEQNYENPEWLMQTKAPDRGRDLSVFRVYTDGLGGVSRRRVIIQCKHWKTRSVSPRDISELREQMKLWGSPRVDVLVIATSGRFTSDAVELIEKNNQSDTSLNIEMWPENHLERLLARKPSIIAEFSLR